MYMCQSFLLALLRVCLCCYLSSLCLVQLSLCLHSNSLCQLWSCKCWSCQCEFFPVLPGCSTRVMSVNMVEETLHKHSCLFSSVLSTIIMASLHHSLHQIPVFIKVKSQVIIIVTFTKRRKHCMKVKMCFQFRRVNQSICTIMSWPPIASFPGEESEW